MLSLQIELVHRLVVGDSVSQPTQPIDQVINICTSRRLQTRKRMAECMSPQRVLVALAEQEPPEAKWKLRDDSARRLWFAISVETLLGGNNIRLSVGIEESEGIVIPVVGQLVPAVPDIELRIQSIAQHDFEMPQHFEEGCACLRIPVVKSERLLDIPAGHSYIRTKAVAAEVRLNQFRCGPRR